MHSNVKLQVAAIFCVCNLVWREEPGAAQRQARLRDIGLYRILQQLRHTKDPQLFDKYEIYMLLWYYNYTTVFHFIIQFLYEY